MLRVVDRSEAIPLTKFGLMFASDCQMCYTDIGYPLGSFRLSA
jgi:hypothetical protein